MKKKSTFLKLGKHPISNRFRSKKNFKEKLYPFILKETKDRLITFKKNIRYEDLIPKLSWVTYSEPEDHLDGIKKILLKKYIKKINTTIGAISFKDDSFIERFSKLGFKTWRIDAVKDLKAKKNSGVESIQFLLDLNKSKKIAKKYGKADLLIVRHIWEHTYNQNMFAKSIKNLIKDDGLILIEVPDYQKSINKLDYTMIWEEHLFYYTKETFINSINENNFKLLQTIKIKYPSEDVLIGIIKKSYKKNKNIKKNISRKIIHDNKNYFKNFQTIKKLINKKISNLNLDGKIVMFGAGHNAVAFISFFNIKKNISYVIDDNKKKQGYYMPNSNIKIISSKNIDFTEISTIVISANQMHEKKINNKLRKELKYKGKIFSIFSTSKKFILKK